MAITQRPSGTWAVIVSYKEGGRYRQRWLGSYPTRAAAQEADARYKRDKARDHLALPSLQPLASYLEDWLEGLEVRERTRMGYRAQCRLYLVPTLGHKPIGAILPRDVEAMLRQLRQLGLSGRTRYYAYQVLSLALKAAWRKREITENPCDFVQPPRLDTQVPQLPSDAELGPLLEAMAAHSMAALWLTALGTGMRLSELLGLQWGDVDWEHSRLGVVRTRQQREGKELISPPKTRSGRRSVAVDPALLAMLRQLPREAIWVFPSAYGSVGNQWRKLRQSIKGPDGKPIPVLTRLRFHDLRHLHLSALLRDDAPLALVSQRAGHANPTITASIYTHQIAGKEASLAVQFAAILSRISAS